MIESPLVQELLAKKTHELIEDVLAVRFGVVPREVTQRLCTLINLKKLNKLHRFAVKCPDIEAFKEQLLALEKKQVTIKSQLIRDFCSGRRKSHD